VLLIRVDKPRWDWNTDDSPWIRPGDIPAAPLTDLRTSQNSELSVWYIENNRSNLARIVAALAGTRDHSDKFDFALFPEAVLTQAQIQSKDSLGNSADRDANSSWHRDLVELTASKLSTLVRLMREQGEIERRFEKQVIELIANGVKQGWIEAQRLKPSLRKAVLGT
jgi:hypothetical protein